MAKPLSHVESEKPQDPSEMDKKETLKGSPPWKPIHQIIPNEGMSVKNPSKQWKDYSTLQDLKYQSRSKSVDLSGRGLRTLHEVDLSNFHQVVELNLSNNPLSSFALRQLPLGHLKKLDLSGCGLKKLDFDRGFIYDNVLQELNLSNNPLHQRVFFTTFYFPDLKTLDLSGCGLKDLRFGQDFVYDNSLEELNLSNNPLCLRPFDSIFYFPHLKKLNLSGCGLKDLLYFVHHKIRLEELDLSNNPLYQRSLSSNVVLSCDVKKLDLSDCGLTELPYALASYMDLQEMNLSNNFVNHLDLLEKLNSKIKPSASSWPKSDTKLFKPLVGITQLPKLKKVLFEDAVYTKSEGVWTVEWHKGIDVSSTSSSESYTKWSTASFRTRAFLAESVPKVPLVRLKGITFSSEKTMLWDKETYRYPYEENDSDEEIYREFCQIKRIRKKLTIENYYSMAFSLKIAVCVLVPEDRPVEDILLKEKTTCGSSLKAVNAELLTIEPTLRRPSLKMPFLVLESITHLKKGVLLLSKWLMGQSYVEETDQRQSIRRAFETAFEKAREAFFSKSLFSANIILVSKLRIISKILESFSKPEAAALACLQLLQELHDLPETRETFSRLDGKEKISWHQHDISRVAVHKINKILFELVKVFLKPSPSAEEWPATIQLVGKNCNPLIDYSYFKSRLLNVSFPKELELFQFLISQQGSQDRCENNTKYSAPVIASGGQTVVKSITVDEEGGCFSVPVASAFLVFPPDAVEGEVTLTCSRVKYKECEVKPTDGEAFVSRILKIEPEGMFFREPVTVLLSHSAYEDDEDFLDFYELIVENLNAIDPQELNSESISCMKNVPKEIDNPEMLSDNLPFAKATIYETCTLVVATRIRAHQILVPTNRTRIFSKKYGENKEVKITFPAGVTEKILCLTVQLFPADDVLNSDVYLDDNLVCVPVIKVSGQTDPFLKPVDVELTYSHNDVADIEEDFLPVGKKIQFTTEYGLLLRNQKETESKSKWLKLNESNEVYVERLRKDQIKFSFSVKHFCKLPPVVKKSAGAQLNVDESGSSVSQSRYAAIVLAVHETDRKRVHAVLAPVTAKKDIKDKWKTVGTRFGNRLK